VSTRERAETCPWCFVKWVKTLGLTDADMRLLIGMAKGLAGAERQGRDE